MPGLFDSLTQRTLPFPNRIGVSPMCQYSAVDGVPNEWHLVHLGGFAKGGAGLVISEATAVVPQGRISPADTGIWNDLQVEAWKPIVRFIESQGSVPGIQLAHAGRKASTRPPWEGVRPIDPGDPSGWLPEAPSPLAFSEQHTTPHELSAGELAELVKLWAAAAKRAFDAGFKLAELHMAHGYLLHEFLSPVSNQRRDLYGGSWENRARFPLEVVEAVRAVWPESRPLWVRLSCRDWVKGGWTLEESVELAKALKERGVDAIDCSSGGNSPGEKGKVDLTQHVVFAETIRREAEIATAAVGGITDPDQAQGVVASGQADMVLLARQLLREPTWPQRAARELGVDLPWPKQYQRAKV